MDSFFTVFSEYLWQYPLFVLLISVFFLVYTANNYFRSSKFKLPPSPPRFPFIGNLHQLGRFPYRSLRALAEKYGPLMLLHFGHSPIVVVSSSDLVKEIVKNHDVVFSDRPKATATDVLFYKGQDISFSPYGDFWKQTRRICAFELLSLKRVQSFESVRVEETAEMVERLREDSINHSVVNLSKILMNASNNIVTRCVLGQRFDAAESKLGELAKRMSVDLVAISVGDLFPSLRWIDTLRGFISRMKSTARVLDDFYSQVIKEHEKRMSSSSSNSKDFVDILLQLQKDPSQTGLHLTHQHVKAIIQDMLLGGIETTSTIMEWLMAELLKNPRVMKKAQNEVRNVVGKKAKIHIEDINRMNYLKCVITENLRLHPPLPLLVPRETSKDIEIGGYHIPKKTKILINCWMIQRHPSTWDNPEEFIPERFENKPINFKSQEYFELIPFGFGRRICPGMTFGIFTIEYLIANLLYWFDWEFPTADGDQAFLPRHLDMSEVYGLTVCKKAPLYVLPKHYSP